MRMLFDNVLLKEVKSKSPVIMTDRTKGYPETGEVMSVGKGDWYGYNEFVATSVKKGDMVYFVKDRAMRVELKAGIFYVVRERDILGVLEKNELK